MPIDYRPFEETDAAAVCDLRRAIFPDEASCPSGWRRQEAALEEERHPRRRWVALHQAEVVGAGCVWNTFAPRKHRLDLAIRPDRRRLGIGSGLLERLLHDLRLLGAVSLQARAGDDQHEALGFLQRRGFRETQRMVWLSLPLDALDLPFLQAQARCPAGLRITTLAEEQARRPDCLRAVHAAHNAALEGWPDPDPDPVPTPPSPPSYEAFLRSLEELRPLPDAFFLACRGEDVLGYSSLAIDERHPACLLSAGTAVRAAERGRGIATALKARTLLHAVRNGWREMRTSSANPAMRRVNEKFGFRRGRAEVRLVRLVRRLAGG